LAFPELSEVKKCRQKIQQCFLDKVKTKLVSPEFLANCEVITPLNELVSEERTCHKNFAIGNTTTAIENPRRQ
jgi:hypothetical protein